MVNRFKEFKKLRYFIILWLGQSLSELGSSMTSFAIILWAYEKTGSALTLSLLGVCTWIPKIVGGIFAGAIVDRLNKKTVMICADLGAGICTFIMLILISIGKLEIWHIYVINIISGTLGSFQSPANEVTTTLIVPKEYFVKTSGMRSFSGGMIQIFAPMLAAFVFSIAGMNAVILVDLLTMLFACFTLVFFIKIPQIDKTILPEFSFEKYKNDLAAGYEVIKNNICLKYLVIFFCFINLVAGITYFSILSPMILARSYNNAKTLALVNGALGVGGISGGIFVSIVKSPKSKIKAIFINAALSFFFGDLLFAIGWNQYIWVLAAFLSSIFIPFINANENYVWRTNVAVELQGRVFSFKRAMQSAMLPLGLFLGGFLSDKIFEPLMVGRNNGFSAIVGNTAGSGMALMFLFTGVLGTAISLAGRFNKRLQKAEKESEF